MSERTVIVTGASSGIGEATARAFDQAGDRVVLTARRADRLKELAADLRNSLVIPGDLTNPETIARIIFETLEHSEKIDVLVNNAGFGRHDLLERLSREDIRSEVEVTLLAPILLTHAVLPSMLARRRGVIINVASVAARIGTPTMSIYNTTKFGLHGFGEALFRELRPLNVYVCTIYLGSVAGTEFGKSKGAGLTVRTPEWLRLTVQHVANKIVQLADRPRPRLVVPWILTPMMAVNNLFPGVVDAMAIRAARRLRPATESAPS